MKDYQKIAKGLEAQVKALREKNRKLKQEIEEMTAYAYIQKVQSPVFWIGGYNPETAEFDSNIESAEVVRGKKTDVQKFCCDLSEKLGEDLKVIWQESPNLPGSSPMQALFV